MKALISSAYQLIKVFGKSTVAFGIVKLFFYIAVGGIRGRQGRSKGDIPGVRFKVSKVNGISLLELVNDYSFGRWCTL